MARPRVFVSSTYFDLKAVRADLEHFIRDRGFDPVLHERGAVPYGKEAALEEYCYREIETCDILIAVIGGKFGSTSNKGTYSISQMELKTAVEQGKQVYIFVEREVFHEYKTYERNKKAKVEWVSVDDPAIFSFLDEVYGLPNNNPISPFETSHNITDMLKEQWAGIFQRLLQQSSSENQVIVARDLRQSLDTVRSLVNILSSKVEENSEIVQDILLTNHPIFKRTQTVLRVSYRVFFTNRTELTEWLKARNFDTVDEEDWDDSEHIEWLYLKGGTDTLDLFKVHVSLFQADGRLRPVRADEWNENWVRREIRPRTTAVSETAASAPDTPPAPPPRARARRPRGGSEGDS